MRRVLTAFALLVLSGAVFAQSPQNTQKFDAADIGLRLKTGTTGQPNMTGGVLRGWNNDLRNATMVDFIATAYSITDPEWIVGGPAWLERNRFHIRRQGTANDHACQREADAADAPGRTLQARIAQGHPADGRLRSDAWQRQAQAQGSGRTRQRMPGLAAAPAAAARSCEPGTCRGVTMDEFAALLRNIGNGYINSPVVNQTGLQGYWDFDVAFTPFPALQRAALDAITIPQFIEKDLGLKLDQGRVPTAVYIVDTVNAEPTPNPSGVSASIPSPPPMEFDVAEIKLSLPDAPPQVRLLPGGRIEGNGITMHLIMQIGWDLTVDELVANTPKWWTTRNTAFSRRHRRPSAASGRTRTPTSRTSRPCCASSSPSASS